MSTVRFGWLSGLLGMCVGACADPITELALDEPPESEVVLQIEAGERVAQRTALLRVQLVALPSLPEPNLTSGADALVIEEPRRRLEYTTFAWPHVVSLPEDMLQEGAAFWVEVQALDVTGNVLTTARLISAQQIGRVLEPTIALSDLCLNVICGSRASTCSESGFCSRAVRAPEGFASRPIP